jgi:hypothetical protein
MVASISPPPDRGIRPNIPARQVDGRGGALRIVGRLGWDYFAANAKSAINTAASSCIAGMACE